MTVAPNHLYYGDNLVILRDRIPAECVDLIYLDPPFKSDRLYNVLFRSEAGAEAAAQIQAFDDTWRWSQHAEAQFEELVGGGAPTRVADAITAMRHLLDTTDLLAYLVMMTVRLVELHRVLRPTGSLYLHCDPTASHYLKILLDAIFGAENFRSEIVWRRSNAHNKVTTQYGPIHDTILFYSKTDTFTFHPGARPYTKAYIEDRFKLDDERGRYQLNYLTGPGTRKGLSGSAWRGFNPTKAGRHWAIPASLRGFLPKRGAGMTTEAQLEQLLAQELIVFPKKPGGQPMYKQYVGPGVPYQDIWAYQPNTRGVLFESNEHIDQDVKWLEAEVEKLGFDTQKPVGLLERIITTSSNPNDVVLDPFCGCGTATDAAQKLNRRWIGIDITYLAIDLIRKRLRNAYGKEIEAAYTIHGVPADSAGASALFRENPFDFERWAVSLIDAQPNEKQVGDRGIDGRMRFHVDEKRIGQVLVSVKGGKTLNPAMVRELRGTVEREGAEMGVLITFAEPTRGMREEADKSGSYELVLLGQSYPRIQIVTVPDLLSESSPKLPSAISPYLKAKPRNPDQLKFD